MAHYPQISATQRTISCGQNIFKSIRKGNVARILPQLNGIESLALCGSLHLNVGL